LIFAALDQRMNVAGPQAVRAELKGQLVFCLGKQELEIASSESKVSRRLLLRVTM
jgi:hypothetical protein